jgi:hypothetical protein
VAQALTLCTKIAGVPRAELLKKGA